uniref:G-protein coupled receptors family 1 profile domain-containing protein n=1 Tax=Leptobrachium leishanense TaxID=445787 RepID=A0A8C5WFU3_9ANUR
MYLYTEEASAFNWSVDDESYDSEWDTDDSTAIILNHLPVPTISLICYSLTFVVGIVGNSLVIWIAGFKMKSISAVWFFNLAVTDLICNIALLLRITEGALYILEEWIFRHAICKISTPLMFFNMLSSVYFLTVISIDRCVSIMWPLWSKVHRSHRLAKIVSVVIWLLSLIITLPHVVFYNTVDDMSDCYPKYTGADKEIYRNSVSVILSTKLASMFVVPFLIFVVCYGLISVKMTIIKRSGRPQRTFKVIAAIVLCFFICWCPYNIWPLIILSDEYSDIDYLVSEICYCLAYANSCLNPIIYVLFCKEFKDSLRKAIVLTKSKKLEPLDLNEDGCMNELL